MKKKAGQSLLETCIVMMVLCLVFFGLLQLSQLSAFKEVLDYAAGCGARARTVGFNQFMVDKVVRVAAIPNAGRLVEPAIPPQPVPAPFFGTPGQAWDYARRAQPASPQYPVESARIPLFLGAENDGRLAGILDYANWDSIIRPLINDPRGAGLGVHTAQAVPLWVPLHRLIYDGEEIRLTGDSILENHYPLYLGYDRN